MKEGQIRREFRREIRYVFFHLKYKVALDKLIKMVAWASSTRRGKIIRMLVQDQQEWPLWRMPMAVSGCFRPVVVGVLEYLPNSQEQQLNMSLRSVTPTCSHPSSGITHTSCGLDKQLVSFSMWFKNASNALTCQNTNGTRQVTRQEAWWMHMHKFLVPLSHRELQPAEIWSYHH